MTFFSSPPTEVPYSSLDYCRDKLDMVTMRLENPDYQAVSPQNAEIAKHFLRQFEASRKAWTLDMIATRAVLRTSAIPAREHPDYIKMEKYLARVLEFDEVGFLPLVGFTVEAYAMLMYISELPLRRKGKIKTSVR
jgi:hypothetical protein